MTTTDDRPGTEPEVDETTAKRLLAGRQIVAKLLAEEIAGVAKGNRDDLEPQMLPRESIVATLPDGTVIGEVKRAKAPKSAQVTDEEALLAWVAEHRPDEIVVKRSVRSSYVDALKAQAKKDGWAYDPATMEIIPGIEVVEGTSSYRPTPDEDARDIVMPRLFDLLAGGLLPQLSAPDHSEGGNS
jgi:phage host-nuclease inhibitor protein Gam